MSASWDRAMAIVAKKHAAGARKRYRVRGYFIEGVGWAYDVTVAHLPPVSVEPIVMTKELWGHLTATLPRCAQRARSRHGGGSKMAITDKRMAEAMAAFSGVRAYRCKLPAPAIGEHWHLTTSKRRRAG